MPTPRNTISLSDLAAANALLVSMGAEDQMPRIAAASVERSIELQSRIERALSYAETTPGASVHARNMARILDGSITVDDELNEVPEQIGHPAPRRITATEPAARKEPKGPRGKLKPGHGLAGRSTKERLEIRAWIAEQGFNIAPSGRIPQEYLDAYDQAKEHRRQARIEQRRNAGQSELVL